MSRTMHSTTRAAHRLGRVLRSGVFAASASVPLYLCPALQQRLPYRHGLGALCSIATQATQAHVQDSPPPVEDEAYADRVLPTVCSGCGAFSQTDDPNFLGYYDIQTQRVNRWLHPRPPKPHRPTKAEDEIVRQALAALNDSKLRELNFKAEDMISGHRSNRKAFKEPVKYLMCERCHNLKHHSLSSDTAKLAVYHPIVESLRETIEQSPWKYNHIYHVIDAADFPMSLIPRLNVLLGGIPLRSRNRRSPTSKFQHGRQIEMSFIIARSDLLAPKKEMVNAMMPYLKGVLRDALGRLGGRVRLGNVHCVSALRGWWCVELKEDIWHRGGAGWMVGKINVGKSLLFEAIYPKGRLYEGEGLGQSILTMHQRDILEEAERSSQRSTSGEDTELLPPPQPLEKYPSMPLVSALPGTTASPIRVPFGNGKGELIDLPGLERSDLQLFVQEKFRPMLLSRKRIVPQQIVVKQGSSIVLGGGLIQLTPREPSKPMLLYNFTPLPEHRTSTEKAFEFQTRTRKFFGDGDISTPETAGKIQLAGIFPIREDVTKDRAGPLVDKSGVGLKVERLPFRVLSTDILIEGVGYVEVTVQVREYEFRRWSQMQRAVDAFTATQEGQDDDPFKEISQKRKDSSGVARARPPEPDWPAIEVYTPEGRFIGSRKPIQGWLNNKPLHQKKRRKRPGRSMKGAKKRAKATARKAASG